MLEKMKSKKIGSIFFSLISIGLIIIPTAGLSVSFGAYPKKDNIVLGQGESGEFEILFFSRAEQSLQFYLSAKEYPKSFIITYPEKFNLNSEFLKDEYVFMNGEYIKAKVVNVGVNVPNNAESGEYKILLNVLSADEESGSSFLNVNVEKTFLLKIFVGEVPVPEENGTIKSVGGLIVGSENITASHENKSEGVETDINGEVDITKEPERDVEKSRRTNPITGFFAFVSENRGIVFLMIGLVGVVIIYLIYKKSHSSNKTNSSNISDFNYI